MLIIVLSSYKHLIIFNYFIIIIYYQCCLRMSTLFYLVNNDFYPQKVQNITKYFTLLITFKYFNYFPGLNWWSFRFFLFFFFNIRDNASAKTRTYLEENIRESLHDCIGQLFLRNGTKGTGNERINWTLSKLKSVVLQRALSRKWKEKP